MRIERLFVEGHEARSEGHATTKIDGFTREMGENTDTEHD